MKYTLTDTFNCLILSRHRSLESAVKARAKHGRAVRKSNGESSYIPTEITETVAGESRRVDWEELQLAEHRAGI